MIYWKILPKKVNLRIKRGINSCETLKRPNKFNLVNFEKDKLTIVINKNLPSKNLDNLEPTKINPEVWSKYHIKPSHLINGNNK